MSNERKNKCTVEVENGNPDSVEAATQAIIMSLVLRFSMRGR
jgi:hypothetical protein